MTARTLPALYIVDDATGSVYFMADDELVAAPMWADPDSHDGDLADWANVSAVDVDSIEPGDAARCDTIEAALRALADTSR